MVGVDLKHRREGPEKVSLPSSSDDEEERENELYREVYYREIGFYFRV